MIELDRVTLRAARELVGRLRELGTIEAPATLLGGVQDRLGLGDAFATFDSPLGLAFVAFSPAGVRMVDVGRSPRDFADAYKSRFGREIRRAARLPDDLMAAIRQSFEQSIFLATSRSARPTGGEMPGTSRRPERAGNLTKRETEILRLVAEGYSNSQAAEMLWVTEQTVKFHLSNIYKKLHVANRTEARDRRSKDGCSVQ